MNFAAVAFRVESLELRPPVAECIAGRTQAVPSPLEIRACEGSQHVCSLRICGFCSLSSICGFFFEVFSQSSFLHCFENPIRVVFSTVAPLPDTWLLFWVFSLPLRELSHFDQEKRVPLWVAKT